MNILHLALCPIVHIIVCENSGHFATPPPPLQKFQIWVALASEWLKTCSIQSEALAKSGSLDVTSRELSAVFPG